MSTVISIFDFIDIAVTVVAAVLISGVYILVPAVVKEIGKEVRGIYLTQARSYLLNIIDFNHAQATGSRMKGLAYILPQDVLSGEEPIDVAKYFTDEEADIVVRGLKHYMSGDDNRTKSVAKIFKF